MKKHDDFEIWLHDDGELSDIQGTKVVLRGTLRKWPLSVVERVTFSDGTNLIYKAFRNLPVETEFYRTVKSRHIPKVFYNHSEDNQHWLLLEIIEGRHPVNLNRDEMLCLALRVRKIIDGLASVEELYRYDLSPKGYDRFVFSIIGLLSKLHTEQKFKTVDKTAVARIEKALSHPDVLRIIHGRCALLHGDLKCDNILIRPDGEIAVIDWQNILFGPEEIDTYTLMATQDIDPIPTAGIGPEILRSALLIKWFADCSNIWLPYWAGFYDGTIAGIEKHMQHIVENN